MKVDPTINRQKDKNRTPREIEDKVINLWNNFYSDKEISKLCGVSPRTVYNIIKRRMKEEQQ